jgi:hypothetical protein
MWEYWWYDNSDSQSRDPWRKWYDNQAADVRARHDLVFRFLDERINWGMPYAKKLDDGLVEIRIVTKVQHRLIGFNWPHGRLNFTFVVSCTHKGKVYDPRNALTTAGERMKKLKGGFDGIRHCERPQ